MSAALETVEEAWKRIYGTPFDDGSIACLHFHVGFNAGRGRS